MCIVQHKIHFLYCILVIFFESYFTISLITGLHETKDQNPDIVRQSHNFTKPKKRQHSVFHPAATAPSDPAAALINHPRHWERFVVVGGYLSHEPGARHPLLRSSVQGNYPPDSAAPRPITARRCPPLRASIDPAGCACVTGARRDTGRSSTCDTCVLDARCGIRGWVRGLAGGWRRDAVKYGR